VREREGVGVHARASGWVCKKEWGVRNGCGGIVGAHMTRTRVWEREEGSLTILIIVYPPFRSCDRTGSDGSCVCVCVCVGGCGGGWGGGWGRL
jgi:hypothetical protein